MPLLKNLDHEIFAQGIARGLTVNDSYAELGFAPDSRNAGRLMKLAAAIERVAALRAEQAIVAGTSPMAVIIALIRTAAKMEDLDHPVGIKEARQCLIEAAALRERMRAAPQQRFNYGVAM